VCWVICELALGETVSCLTKLVGDGRQSGPEAGSDHVKLIWSCRHRQTIRHGMVENRIGILAAGNAGSLICSIASKVGSEHMLSPRYGTQYQFVTALVFEQRYNAQQVILRKYGTAAPMRSQFAARSRRTHMY
jgi:hypothetical protein